MSLIDDVKAYARIDDADDALASALVNAAETYLENAGVTKDETNPLYCLAVQMLATHWYDNRGVVQVGATTKQFEMGISGIILQLQNCYTPQITNIKPVAALPTTGIDATAVYVLTADDGLKLEGTMWRYINEAWVEYTVS